MLNVPINLASKPFFNNRRFYTLSLVLILAFFFLSVGNLYFYLAYRSRSIQLNQDLVTQAAEIKDLEREQEQIWRRLQRPETEEFLDLVDYLNPLISQRIFSWTQFLNFLERLVPYNVQILMITPQIVEGEVIVEIICNAKSGFDYIQFVSRLESSGNFYEVNLVEEDISKTPGFIGKQYGLRVKYQISEKTE